MIICVTGANGLIGSSVCESLIAGNTVIGIDNNMRETFFGKEGSTKKQRLSLLKHKNYLQKDIDIRDKSALKDLFNSVKIDAVFHCAAQPSHDKAKEMIQTDFEINTIGTLNILEELYRTNHQGSFIFTSTNKVYGDNPNRIALTEQETRFAFKDSSFEGFTETCSTDNCTHSFFGASKLAADTYTQEYGRCLGLNTTVLRLGCVTGAHHAGVKLHGFLSFLIKSLVSTNSYEIIGYKGKQVRDQIHVNDVSGACIAILNNPTRGEVFNLGGGTENSASIIELISLISKKLHSSPTITYVDTPRIGDHICYITDTFKFRRHFPTWKISRSLESIVDELIAYELSTK